MFKSLGILVLAVGAAVLITGPKLVKMATIRGWLPGATVSAEVITQKWDHASRTGHAYWVAWSERDIREVGPHRLNVPQARWERLAIGDTITIVRVRRDRQAYLRDGIYASTGNFVLDVALLILEIGIVLAMIRRLRHPPAPSKPQEGVRF
jgi:hypothetical protein